MPNIIDILARALSLRQETALNSITPNRAGGIMYDTLLVLNQMQLEGGALLISKVYASVSAMEADTTPTSDLTGRALKPGQLVVIVTSDTSSSDMGSEYRYNGPGSWTYVGKVGGLPLDTVPTQSSTKGITSGGVYTALAAMKAEGYKYMGLATPGSGGTTPGTPNQPVFYIAGPGSYPNFGSITVASGYLGFIKYSGGSWSVESVAVGKDYDEEISQLQQRVAELEQKVDENATYSYSETQIPEDSPYYEDKITGAYLPNNTRKISSANNYNLYLFRLPAGTYKLNVSGTGAISGRGVIFSIFASTSDFVLNGSPSEVIAVANSTDQEYVRTFAEETLLCYCVYFSFTWNGTIKKIEDETVKEKIESLDEQVAALDELPGEVEELSERTADIEEELKETNYVNLTESSPYFTSSLSGAYVPHSTQKITSDQYTTAYKLFLFTLPAGKYRLNTLISATSQGVVFGTLSSPEDLVAGTTIASEIIYSPSGASSQVATFTETTYLFLLGRVDMGINYYVSAEEIVVSSKLDDVANKVENLFKVGLDIVIPDTVYAIVGTELNIWNDTVALSIDRGLHSPLNYQVRWECNKGTITDRGFRFTPVAGDTGDVSCTCYIYDMRGVLLASKTFTIKVKAKNALASAKNIVYFGDSLGANAASALYDNFHDANRFGGTIPNMLGTRGTTKHYEAAGGYKWSNYATAGEAGFRISVSGVTSLQIGAVYSDGSHNFEILEVNITEGSGNCLLGQHYSGTLIMPSGTLTKVSGGGDASVPYTDAFQESANPLWNDATQELDIDQYKQMLVSLGQLSAATDKIDAVSFQFGINDNTLIDNPGTLLGYITDLYNLFVDDNPDCIFIVGLTTSSCNTVSGSGANYGATQNWKRYLENTYKIRKFYLSLLADFPNMRIATPNLLLDRYYGYPMGTRQVSDRCTETEAYHTNFVHPTTSGYKQMGDAYLAAFVAVLTES